MFKEKSDEVKKDKNIITAITSSEIKDKKINDKNTNEGILYTKILFILIIFSGHCE